MLRLFLDREGGITLDHCTAATQLISPLLDADNFIEGRYMLEVSSPGIARPIRKPADFERFAGEQIRVKTHAPVEGRSRFTGILKGFGDGLIELDCDGREYRIHLENLHKANLDC